jgi:hypothetical protein
MYQNTDLARNMLSSRFRITDEGKSVSPHNVTFFAQFSLYAKEA